MDYRNDDLKQKIKSLGLTQKEFGKMVGVHGHIISLMCNGYKPRYTTQRRVNELIKQLEEEKQKNK